MEFDKVLKKRRSVRKYKADPVPREAVLKVLEAARIAPSAAHRQPWHFIVVEDAEMRAKLAGSQAWAAEAPVTVVAFADEEASPSWCSNDVGIAFEHLVLAATDLGLGTCWMGLTRRDEEIRGLLCAPESLKVVAMTPLGVPDEKPAPKERKGLDEIVSWGEYGKQAE
jgi:nitroreductase